MAMVTKAGELHTFSGQCFSVVRGGGCIDLAITRRRDTKAMIPLSVSEARELADLLREVAELEQYRVECTLCG